MTSKTFQVQTLRGVRTIRVGGYILKNALGDVLDASDGFMSAGPGALYQVTKDGSMRRVYFA